MNNYGLSGQEVYAYDNFLCLSKKCKQRKAERHKAKIEKRKLKNDQRRAETEAMRAETSMLNRAQKAVPQVVRQPTVIQQPAATPKPQQAGFAGNSMMMLVGVLLVGGLIYSQVTKKKAAPPLATPAIV